MNKLLLSAGLLISSLTATAGLTINFSSPDPERKVILSTSTIDNIVSAASRTEIVTTTDTISAPQAVNATDYNVTAPSRVNFYIVSGPDNNILDEGTLYMKPGDNLITTVQESGMITSSGTELMEKISELDGMLIPYVLEAQKIRSGESTEDLQKVYEEYSNAIESFANANKDSEGVLYALLSIDGEEFMTLYDSLGAHLRESIIYPLIEKRSVRIKANVEKERKQKEMENSHADAPDFTLPSIDGKMLSLSDFRGKWIILDFWGSWCGWCIKGFPALKEAYKNYDGKIEVIGIDCGDTVDQWRAAVKRFELPWVNVYNEQKEGSIDQIYGVQGFPTKIIINPERKVYKIVTGEDPTFYDELAKLVN